MDPLISTLIVGVIILLIICAAIYVIIRDHINGRNGCEKGCLICRSCNRNVTIDENDNDEKEQ